MIIDAVHAVPLNHMLQKHEIHKNKDKTPEVAQAAYEAYDNTLGFGVL